MLYPVAPHTLKDFIQMLHEKADEAGVPRPEVHRPPYSFEEWSENISEFLDDVEKVESKDHLMFAHRGREWVVMEVIWPGEEAGPDPVAMWTTLQYVPALEFIAPFED